MTRTTKHYGPPGTGKTTRLLGLALEAERAGQSWLYATFSKATQTDALERMMAESGHPASDLRERVRTLHSLAFEAAGHFKDDGTAQVEMRHRKAWCDSVGLSFVPPSYEVSDDLPFAPVDAEGRGAEFFNALDACRHRSLDPCEPANLARFASSWDSKLCERASGLVYGWKRWKDAQRLWEQTDNLEAALDYGVDRAGTAFLADEYQDLTPLLHRFACEIAKNHDRVHLAADDDQAIYTWAGGDASIFLEHPCEEEEVLDQSHRLPVKVWEASQRVIRQVRTRKDKNFKPRAAPGTVAALPRERFPTVTLARASAGRNILILARTNYHVADLSARLTTAGVAHGAIRGATAWSPHLHNACNAILRLRAGEFVQRAEVDSLLSLVPTRGALVKAAKWEVKKLGIPDYPTSFVRGLFLDGGLQPERHLLTAHREAVRAYLERGVFIDTGRLRVGTFHASKGLEADTVIVDSRLTARILAAARTSPHAWDNELRVLYVALTRSRDELFILPTESDNTLLGAVRW